MQPMPADTIRWSVKETTLVNKYCKKYVDMIIPSDEFEQTLTREGRW